MSEPTRKYSISMPRDVADKARERSGPSGLSSYVSAAVIRQLERDNLNELISAAEADQGVINPDEIREKHAVVQRARAKHVTPGPSAA